jgi:hypothetical protein
VWAGEKRAKIRPLSAEWQTGTLLRHNNVWKLRRYKGTGGCGGGGFNSSFVIAALLRQHKEITSYFHTKKTILHSRVGKYIIH